MKKDGNTELKIQDWKFFAFKTIVFFNLNFLILEKTSPFCFHNFFWLRGSSIRGATLFLLNVNNTI